MILSILTYQTERRRFLHVLFCQDLVLNITSKSIMAAALCRRFRCSAFILVSRGVFFFLLLLLQRVCVYHIKSWMPKFPTRSIKNLSLYHLSNTCFPRKYRRRRQLRRAMRGPVFGGSVGLLARLMKVGINRSTGSIKRPLTHSVAACK